MSGLVTAIYDIGCALGAVTAFLFGEKIGRKKSILLANVIVIVGAAIQAASYDYWQMFAARIVSASLSLHPPLSFRHPRYLLVTLPHPFLNTHAYSILTIVYRSQVLAWV
jgi:MFS family permease